MPELTPIGQEKTQVATSIPYQIKEDAKKRAMREGIYLSGLIQKCLEIYGNGGHIVDFSQELDTSVDK